jgi:hypothetical protein
MAVEKPTAPSAPSTPLQRCSILLDELDAVLDSPTSQRSLPYCVVLCLVCAFVWTWSISWVPPLLHNQVPGGVSPALRAAAKALSLPSAVVVIDCGSGKAAAYRYRFSAEGAPLEETKVKVALKLSELLVAAASEPAALDPLWSLIDAATLRLEAPGAAAPFPLFFGATGGVRAALAEGSLSQAHVDGLEAALRNRYRGAPLHFEVLSGAREAQLELRATRYAYRDAALFGDGAAPVGSLSGGGQSCQLAWGTSSKVGSFEAAAVEADLFGAQRVVGAVGLRAALEWWDAHLAQELAKAGLGGPRKLQGPFVGITMQATAAAQAGLGSRVVTAEDAVRGCNALLAHAQEDDALEGPWWGAYFFDQAALGANPYGLDAHTFNLVTVLTVARLKAVLETALEPTALLFFARARDLPSDLSSSGAGAAGQPANTEWALGALLAYPWG